MRPPDLEVLPTAAWADRGAADLAEAIAARPDLRVCLPTGTTPAPVYERLPGALAARGVDASRVTVVLLDEYVGLPAGHPARCDATLRRQLVDRLVPSPAFVAFAVDGAAASHAAPAAIEDPAAAGRTTDPAATDPAAPGDPAATDPSTRDAAGTGDPGAADHGPASAAGTDRGAMDRAIAACRAMDVAIAAAGGLDLVVLGLGSNGHVGMNEPGTPSDGPTRLVALASPTIEAARGYGADPPPRLGVTIGLGPLLAAREIWLLVRGASKAAILARALEGPPSDDCPASHLRAHPRLRVIADEDAASALAGRG